MMNKIKKIIDILGVPSRHWVGDGFPVRSLFSYNGEGQQISPFLLLDYTGTSDFPPAKRLRGVGQHPHRGFETVTIVYEGEVAHRDSTGKGGVIGPGDVQWMTAASGILHEEFHSEAFTQKGGRLDMAQLWVNLPAKDKMIEPGYQAILSAQIPSVPLQEEKGRVRVIAGAYAGSVGPAQPFSPMHVWDLHLNAGALFALPAVESWNATVVLLHGQAKINGEAIKENQVVLLGSEGSWVDIEAETDSVLLYLSGQPLNEPIAGYGPFVMNTEEEIVQAFNDFNNGKFGKM